MATITIEVPDEIAQHYASLDEIHRTMYYVPDAVYQETVTK